MTVKPIVTDIKDVRHFQPYPDLKDKTPVHFYGCGSCTRCHGSVIVIQVER